jgi:hypothetical protein
MNLCDWILDMVRLGAAMRDACEMVHSNFGSFNATAEKQHFGVASAFEK